MNNGNKSYSCGEILLTLTRVILEVNVNSNYELLSDSTLDDLRTIERELEEEMEKKNV